MGIEDRIYNLITAHKRRNRDPIGLVISKDLYGELTSSVCFVAVHNALRVDNALADKIFGLEVSVYTSDLKNKLTVY